MLSILASLFFGIGTVALVVSYLVLLRSVIKIKKKDGKLNPHERRFMRYAHGFFIVGIIGFGSLALKFLGLE